MTELTLPRAISATLMPGFDGPTLPRWVADELDAGLGSICLFDTNITEPDQLRTLTTAVHEIRPQALIATDEEGGDVTRLGHRRGSPYPSPAFLGRQDSVAATEAVGLGIGTELRAAGIDMNLAPDADVNSNPRNPVIGVRSYGSDPQLVARHVAASVRGLHRAGVAACAKHFPGHGDTATDSHLDRPVVDVDPQTLAVRELVPFRAAVSAGVLAVMTSHILVPAVDADLPATLSPRVLALLRHDLGFDGVIVSDALDMAGASADRGIAEAAVLALRAGVDLMCVGSGNTGEQVAGIRAHIAEAVRSGRLAEARVDASSGCRRRSTGCATVRRRSASRPRWTPRTSGAAPRSRRCQHRSCSGWTPRAIPLWRRPRGVSASICAPSWIGGCPVPPASPSAISTVCVPLSPRIPAGRWSSRAATSPACGSSPTRSSWSGTSVPMRSSPNSAGPVRPGTSTSPPSAPDVGPPPA
jgi:beta-N-acetylhexosaminidase